MVEGLNAYILVFCRMGGAILFNPFLTRRNVPSQVKIALMLGLTLLLAPSVGGTLPEAFQENTFLLVSAMVEELLVGVACGYVFQIFYYLLFTAGDIIDMGFGLSMAKAFDPGTNIQLSRSGAFFQIIFLLYIFATNSHLLMIKIFASSYDIVSIGAVTFGENIAKFLLDLFVSTFSLAIHLALPFIAASFVLEISMGILMKLIPQINVFTIHFQFMIILGLFLLFFFAGPISNFLDNYMDRMFVNIQNVFMAAAPS